MMFLLRIAEMKPESARLTGFVAEGRETQGIRYQKKCGAGDIAVESGGLARNGALRAHCLDGFLRHS
jgi:hypothetical protein